MMEEFKQLEIYLFPIVMLLAIGMNNWKREERTQGDRIFGFLPFLIICMMGSDVTYHALQLMYIGLRCCMPGIWCTASS